MLCAVLEREEEEREREGGSCCGTLLHKLYVTISTRLRRTQIRRLKELLINLIEL